MNHQLALPAPSCSAKRQVFDARRQRWCFAVRTPWGFEAESTEAFADVCGRSVGWQALACSEHEAKA